jgi:hypothetical protein
MTLTAYPNGVSSFGAPVLPGGLLPVGGNVYFLDPTNGADGNLGTSPEEAVKTLTKAYALCTDGNDDIVFYMAGTSSISLAAEFLWAKSYTHLIGLGAPTMTGMRSRIFATAGNLDLDPLITISGSGCIWKNIRVFHGVDDAEALVAVSVTGNYNYVESCHFAGGGHATNAVDGATSLLLNAGSENTFNHCAFGITTVDAATGVRVLAFDTLAKRNVFEDCLFTLRAGSTSAMLVEVVDATGIEDYQIFNRCKFISQSTNQLVNMASAFVIPASVALLARMMMVDCVGVGFAKWDASDRGILFGNMNDVTPADTSGVLVEMVT